MALENLVGADKFISALVNTNPTGGDDKREGDDHLRGIKNVLKNSFPQVAGAVTATDSELSSVKNKVNRAGDVMTGQLTVPDIVYVGKAITAGNSANQAVIIGATNDTAVTPAGVPYHWRVIVQGDANGQNLLIQPELKGSGWGLVPFQATLNGVIMPQRRYGYVFADGVNAPGTGTYTIVPTGFWEIGGTTPAVLAKFYLMTVLSRGSGHAVQGVALYTTATTGAPVLLATLGKQETGGTIVFGVSGNSPLATITNSAGITPAYYCQIVALN